MTTATALRSRHLLGIDELDPSEIDLVMQTASAMKEVALRPIKKVPTLRGRTVINLFFEPSTRTRMSFELAEKRLSADTLGHDHVRLERREGRDARRHGAHARRHVAGHDRHAPRRVRSRPSARKDLPGQHRQRGRWDARASNAGAARRVHDCRTEGQDCRADGRHRRGRGRTAVCSVRTRCCSRGWAPRYARAARRRSSRPASTVSA